MKQLDRDAMVKLIFPALVVALGYIYYFFSGPFTALRAVEKDLAAARTKAPSPAQLTLAARDNRKLNEQLQQQRAKLDQVSNAWLALLGSCADQHRNERLEKITSLLDRNELKFLDDAEVDGGKERRLQDYLHNIVGRMDTIAPGPRPRMRQIRFEGRYLDVHRALHELGEGPVLALPIGLVMKEAPLASAWREWILIVWL